ncbi:conserved hypothetical protein [Micrococcus luteus]|nr:conserved hypothetical protein [Micrococcus luteus]
MSGGDLLSHNLPVAVPSALWALASGFEESRPASLPAAHPVSTTRPGPAILGMNPRILCSSPRLPVTRSAS